MRILLLITYLLFQQGVGFQGVSLVEGDTFACNSNSAGANFPGDETNYGYVEVFDEPSIAYFRDGEAWTFLTWFRVEQIASDNNALVAQWGSGSDDQVRLRTDQDGVPPTDLECGFSGATNICTESNDVVDADIWYLLAMTNGADDEVDQYFYDTDCVQFSTDLTGTHPTDRVGPFSDLIVGGAWDDSTVQSNMTGDMAYTTYIEGVEFNATQIEAFCNDVCTEAAIHDSNTIFFYDFNNDFLDGSTAGNDGTKRTGGSGDVTFSTYGGPYDLPTSHGVNFPGDETNYCYIEVFDDPAGAYFRQTEAWTFLTWFRVEQTSTDDNGFLAQWGTGSKEQVRFRTDDQTAPADIECGVGGTINNCTDVDEVVETNRWYLHAMTNGTDDAMVQYVYDNGCTQLSIDSNGTHPGDAVAFEDLVVAGRWNGSTLSDNMTGDMAYVTYLEGVEFTQAQVEAFCANPNHETSLHDSEAIFFYEFDGDYLDTSSAGNDGVERLGGSGACAFNTNDGPYDSRSLIFDEINDHVQITDHADLTIPANSDWTVMTWVKATDVATGTDFKYVFSTIQTGDNKINLFIEEDTQFDLALSAQDGGSVSTGQFNTGTAVPEDEWILVAATYDEGTTTATVVQCDRSGSCQSQTSNTNFNSSFDPADWDFGRRADGDVDRYFKGSMAYGALCHQEFTVAQIGVLAIGTKQNFEAEIGNCAFFLNDIMDDDLNTTGCGGSGCTVAQFGSPVIDEDGPFD